MSRPYLRTIITRRGEEPDFAGLLHVRRLALGPAKTRSGIGRSIRITVCRSSRSIRRYAATNRIYFERPVFDLVFLAACRSEFPYVLPMRGIVHGTYSHITGQSLADHTETWAMHRQYSEMKSAAASGAASFHVRRGWLLNSPENTFFCGYLTCESSL